MDSKYIRLPSQDASELLYDGNEKRGNGHRHRLSSTGNMVLLLSVVLNVVLSLSLVLMLRERSTPSGYGEHERENRLKSRLTGLSQGRLSHDHMEAILVEHGLQSQEPL